MIILDRVLRERQAASQPIRVAMIGAGYMGRGLALQINRYTPGMELVAIANRTVSGAERAYSESGIESLQYVESQSALEDAIRKGQYSVTADAQLVCRAEGIDAIIEVTGEIEFGASVVLRQLIMASM